MSHYWSGFYILQPLHQRKLVHADEISAWDRERFRDDTLKFSGGGCEVREDLAECCGHVCGRCEVLRDAKGLWASRDCKVVPNRSEPQGNPNRKVEPSDQRRPPS